MLRRFHLFFPRHLGRLPLLLAALLLRPALAIDLADAPLFSTTQVPGNVALALSVEWPTASTPAYPSTVSYAAASTYYGYFDPAKCYRYVAVYNAATADYASSYFQPDSAASSHACTSSATKSLWSGNYLNWATTHTLDAFRWALTGGNRDVDSSTETILAKTWHAGNGSHASIFPDKKISSGVSGAAPFNWSTLSVRVWGGGLRLWFTSSGTTELAKDNVPPLGAVPYTGQNSYTSTGKASASAIYELYVRIKVCDATVGLESNCVGYPAGNAKPEGLMQQYAGKLRYAAFGYLNDSNVQRDGGVLRARMKYIAPTQPVPGSYPISNAATEWDAQTGVQLNDPDTADSSATRTRALSQGGYSVSVTGSGVLNYLNRFGLSSRSYKSYDPVSELYYAVTRYYRNLGDVASYSSLAGSGSASALATWIDGFPVITGWSDPILYSCQKNFILGIGDVNSHRDANLQGSTIRSIDEPAMPAEVSADTAVNVRTSTNMVGQLEGISSLGTYSSGRNNSYFIAGLAYDAHTRDQRSDLAGSQTVSTYWVDVLEGQTYLARNQYWLAAKYGGFEVPDGFNPYAGSNGTSTLPLNSWTTSGDTLTSGSTTNPRPDNYYTGGQADKIVSGLSKAFARIAAEASAATTTALAAVTPNQTLSGNASYAAGYDPRNWSGNLTGASLSYASDGSLTLTPAWNARDLLDGVSATSRRIVTCCTAGGAALPFRYSNLSGTTLHARTSLASFTAVQGVAAAQQSASNYVDYLRGDRSRELSGGGAYRSRSHLLGDIVNARLLAVGPPSATYHDRYNPGYSAFRRSYASRRSVVYAGANDGMLHAFDGSLSGTGAGSELYAYIPSFVYGDATTGPVSGLAALGNPNYSHRPLVDASPQVFDLDFNRSGTTLNSGSGDWHSVLISGLGKGGRGYVAIDVTDPSSWSSESAVAGKVLWEFTDSRMGYSYGDARVVKTARHGWVVLLASGYNNADGRGYIFFVHPRTGALLETLVTPEGSLAAPINLAHLSAYIPDLTDYSATALYGADLQGNVWRVDLSGSGGSTPAPVKIARLTAPDGQPQPVTAPLRIMIDPATLRRYLLIGTGRLLADSDVASTQVQSFYALVDGDATNGANRASPLGRAQLAVNSTPQSGLGNDSTARSNGWLIDLGRQSGSLLAERITLAPAVNNGVVGVAVQLPGGDACAAAGTSTVMAFSFGSGQSALTDASGAPLVASSAGIGAIADLSFRNVGGRLRLVAGRSSGEVLSLSGAYGRDTPLRRLNWREIPTAD
ncbi:MAG: hypothetical protein RJA44_423 [Pseudomonadota bacterium]